MSRRRIFLLAETTGVTEYTVDQNDKVETGITSNCLSMGAGESESHKSGY